MSRHDHLEMDPVYGVSHFLIVQLYEMFFRGEVAGVANVPKHGAFLIASNHASVLDPPFVGCQITRQICFFARKTLWKPGFPSWWLDAVGTIPVDREGGDVAAIKRVLQAIQSGKIIILFPEGTRSSDGRLQSAKPGVGLLACRTQVPVVPARVFGSFEALGRDGRWRLGTPVSVAFGPPLMPADYDDPAADKVQRYQRASEKIMSAIAALESPQPAII